MIRKLLFGILILVYTQLNALEIKDYMWRIPISPFAVEGVVISDDESRIIFCHSNGYSVYDLNEDTLISRIRYKNEGSTTAYNCTPFFLTNNEILLAEYGSFYLYNILKKEKNLYIDILGVSGPYSLPAVSHDKKIFVFKDYLGKVFITDTQSRQFTDSLSFDLQKLTVKDDKVTSFTFSPDNSFLIILTEAGFVITYDLTIKEIIKIDDVGLKFGIPLDSRFKSNYNQIEIISDSTIICNISNKTGIINFKTGNLIKMILPDYPNGLINISKNKRYFTGLNFGSNVFIYDLENDNIISFLENQYPLRFKIGLGFLEEKSQIIYQKDGSLSRYNFINNETVSYFGMYSTNIFRFTPDNKFLYTGSKNYWKIDVQTGKTVERNDKDIFEINNKCTHFVNLKYATNDKKHSLHICNIQTKQDEYVSEFDGNYIYVKYSSDDKYFAMINPLNNTIKIIETTNYSTVDSFLVGKTNKVSRSVNFSKDNQLISYSADDDTLMAKGSYLYIRDIQKKENLCSLKLNVLYNDKFIFLKNNELIGHNYSSDRLSIFKICESNDFYVKAQTETEIIENFYISNDSKYCFGLSIGYGYPAYKHLFIYDLEKKEHILKYDGNTRNWTLSNDNKYLALNNYDDGQYMYMYNFEEIISSINTDEVAVNDVQIFPNPATDFVNLNFSSYGNTIAPKVEIYNIFGIEVSKSSLTDGNNRINISHLPAGVYYIRIGDKTEKFVKF
jgi:hypothetical protein